MYMNRIKIIAAAVFVLLVTSACTPAAPTIKIGINAEITGDIPKVGEGTRYSAEMWLEQNGGTITVGGTE
jgi:branched-chain amino acid transport system substrate-binding protein